MTSAPRPDAFPAAGVRDSSRYDSTGETQSQHPEPVISLLGRLDLPTDGVRDYCELLSDALARHGKRMEIVSLRWENDGWRKALRRLWQQSRAWEGRIVLLQYTALMWSRRGFPFGVLAILAILKIRRLRLGAVFHDVSYAGGRGWIQRMRRACQIFTIRTVFRCSEFPILTVPASQISWLPRNSHRAEFIPVGANFASCGSPHSRTSISANPTVVVFGITGGAHLATEASQIASAMNYAAKRMPGLRLDVFGRNALHAEAGLRKDLAESGIFLSVAGVLPSEEVRARLERADVLLFVRGPISSRRGSAIAGIVCGIPVVGYRGAETASPITEAGVFLVDNNDGAALREALVQVLTDPRLYADLCNRNAAVTVKHLSWDAIAAQFLRVLRDKSHVQDDSRG